MAVEFPSQSLKNRIDLGAADILARVGIRVEPSVSPASRYTEFLLERFRELWLEKHGERYGEGKELRNTEVLLRYLQLNFIRAIRRDGDPEGPRVDDLRIISSHQEALEVGSFYPKTWRFQAQVAIRRAQMNFGEAIPVDRSVTVLRDLTIARLWFLRHEPISGETTWELYQRYDPDGERAMNQAHFYSLLPQEWRSWRGGAYHVIQMPWSHCRDLESWCLAEALPTKGSSAEAILKLYDPLGHQGWTAISLYQVLPAAWRARVVV